MSIKGCLATARSQVDPAEDIELSKDLDRIQALLIEGTIAGKSEKEAAILAVQQVLNAAAKEHEALVKRIDATMKPEGYGKKNKVFTEKAKNDALKVLREKLGRVSANPILDPEILQAGITVAGYHIEAGLVKFQDWAKAVIADMHGFDVTPYLRQWYEAARYQPGVETDGMTPVEDMASAVAEVEAYIVEEVTPEIADEPTAGRGNTQEEPDVRGDRTGDRGGQGNRTDPEVEGTSAEDGDGVGAPGDTEGIRPRDRDREGTGREQEPEVGDGLAGQPGTVGTGSQPPVAGGTGRTEELESRGTNYVITDPAALVSGTPKKRFAKNRKALETYQEIEETGREATPEDKDAIASYIGWGSFGQELFQGTWAQPVYKDGWEAENDWLRQNLGQSEWESAQASIRNSHYTDPPTVQAMWKMVERMGFKGGKVLEPSMGIGNFFGLMPPSIEGKSTLAGIELDELSAGMAKILYPLANIHQKGYQDSHTPDHFYDLVIGNWPFDSEGPADRRYNKLSPSLHDYFFLKAVDQVRPGGLVVGITSRYTMDSVAKSVRMEIGKKAELVASIRLPSGAFKDYAGTSVVTDIVVLRKRQEPIPDSIGEGWIESPKREIDGSNKANINEYYDSNPENILGELAWGHGTTYGREGVLVNRPDNFESLLDNAPDLVPEGIYDPTTVNDSINYVTNNTNDRTNSIIVKDGELMVVRGEYLAPLSELHRYVLKDAKKTADRVAQLSKLVGLRKNYGRLLDAERAAEPNVEAIRKELKKDYDAFVEAHGYLNDSFGLGVYKKLREPFYPSLAGLEVRDGDTWAPMAILTRPVSRQKQELKNPSIRDAYAMQRNHSIYINPESIAEQAGVTEAEVIDDLVGNEIMYQAPDGSYEPADVYLSGNVRRKLREAKDALALGEPMEKNVAALEKVIPADIPYFNIEPQMGAQWVAPQYYQQFIAEALVNMPEQAETGIAIEWQRTKWKVRLSNEVETSPDALRLREITAYKETGKVDAEGKPVMQVVDRGTVRLTKLIEAAFNNLTMKFTGRDSDGNQYTRTEFSTAANELAGSIREQFQDWIWKDASRKVALEKDYNEIMNAIAPPKFDGSFLTFDGMALQRGENEFNLRSHQVNAIWRGIVQGSGLYAHEVGTGKTYTMGGIAVESRRLGLAKKPLILAHNANSSSVAAEINEMYPSAKVLYIDNLSPGRVDVALRQIANDDWDAVVMPHSLIDRLSLTEPTLMALAQEEITALEDEFFQQMEDEGLDGASVNLDNEDDIKKIRNATAKDLARQRLQIKNSIRKQAQRSSREDALAFEDLGVDMVMVDEAHVFKKPPIATRMKMKGLQTQTSNRSIALNFLLNYVRRENNGRGVQLFTGTPITNTLTEIFHMQRYVMSPEMERDGVAAWDSWFNTFAAGESDVEYTASGDYKAVTSLTNFVNVAELRRMMSPYMDVVFADDMPEFDPRETKSGKTSSDELTESEADELLNGRTENPVGRPYKKEIKVVSDMTPEQLEVFSELKKLAREWDEADGKTRFEWMRAGDEHSPVQIDNVATKLGLDPRMHDINLTESPEAKVVKVHSNLMEIYNSHPLANQVVFVDKGYNDTKQQKGNTVPTFNLVKELVNKLVASGVPESEIRVVKGGVTQEQRRQISADMNDGNVRIVIGQTETLGTGTNMQDNLRAMHHFDAPWMPGELEQRNGRGHRQGNKWNTVLEYRYLTDKLDGKRWQTLARKARIIKQFLQADENLRVIDGDAASDVQDSFSETLAEAIGDARLLIRQKLTQDIAKLQRKERVHTQGIVDAKQRVARNKDVIPKIRANADAARKDSISYVEARDQADANQKDRNTEAYLTYVKSTGVKLNDGELQQLRESGHGPAQKNRDLANRVATSIKIATEKGNERPKPETTVPFEATLLNRKFTNYEEFDKAFPAIKGQIPQNMTDAYPVGDVFGFTLEAEPTGIRGSFDYQLVSKANPNETYRIWQNPTGQSIAKVLRNLGLEASSEDARADSLERENESLATVADTPFARQDVLDRKIARLAELEKDMEENPVPPPSWLRHGAPVGTTVYQDSKEFEVEGHQWAADGYYVLVTDGTKSLRIDYLDLKDENNYPLYEPVPFEAPNTEAGAAAVPTKNMTIVLTEAERKTLNEEYADMFFAPGEEVDGDVQPAVVTVDDPNDEKEVAFAALQNAGGDTITFDNARQLRMFIDGINYRLEASPNWRTIRDVTKRAEFLQREIDGGQGRLFSRRRMGEKPAQSARDVREEVKSILSDSNSLLKSGRLKVVQGDADLPAHLQHEMGGVKGVVDPVTGNIYIVADNVGGNVRGVLLHEVGVHHGLRNILGDKFSDVIRQIRGLKAVRNKEALAAYAQVPPDTRPDAIDEEALAYLVESKAAQEMGIVRKVIAAVRAWLFKHGFAVTNLTTDDMLALAAAAARAAGRKPNVPYANMADGTVSPILSKSEQEPSYSLIQSVRSRVDQARGRNVPTSEFYAENQAIREKDRPFWDKVKKTLKRQFSPGGLLPDRVFELKIWRDSQFNVAEIDIKNLVAHYDDAVMNDYGVRPEELDPEITARINEAMTSDAPIPETIGENTRAQLQAMKNYINIYSVEYGAILHNEATRLQAEGKDDAAAAKVELMNTIIGNLNKYQHRSYRAFDDKMWPTKVSDEVLDNARAYLKARFEEKARVYDEWADKADERGEEEKAARHRAQAEKLRDPTRVGRLMRMMLKEGTAFDSMEQYIKESKLGAKDLSILKHRKDIAPEIRALLGEYVDVRVNFAKTASKQNRLIFNQKFLDQVVRVGLGDFLFTDDDAPVDATKLIATGESYSPLNGYYTFPEIEQAFRDALGKDQMADWYRTIIQWNGAIKYGKTILSPTTAMRNWMSAFFFAIANGHFDMTQMAKSVQSVREYFTHRGAGLAYLRKLQGLGVVYDTPYAGEMMRLLKESKIEDQLTTPGGMKIKRAMDFAQKFYQFGDDFWKILGFENEVALLMKHKDLSREDAEVEAAERIRNTYPTYSMTGKFVNALRRFPLAGTFVSFPSEIVRTTYHILRYLKQDMADPQLRPLAMRRIAGLAIASGLAHGLQFAAMALAGVDEDEEEAFRQLAAPWQKNSNIIPLSRDDNGNLRFLDMSFMDPYNYWKRPINAILRDQPYEEMFKSIAEEVYKPFFGTDIAAGAIIEILTNTRDTGGRIFNPQDTVPEQTLAMAGHLWKNIQPGITSNMTRTMYALEGKTSPSGRKYNLVDEIAAFSGIRFSTHDPRAALFYKSFEFRDMKRDSTSIMTAVARDPNKVSDSELKYAFDRAMTVRHRAYTDMARLVSAARSSGISELRLRQVLSQSGISKKDVFALLRGEVPVYRPSKRYLQQAVNKARVLFPDMAETIEKRRETLRSLPQPTLR